MRKSNDILYLFLNHRECVTHGLRGYRIRRGALAPCSTLTSGLISVLTFLLALLLLLAQTSVSSECGRMTHCPVGQKETSCLLMPELPVRFPLTTEFFLLSQSTPKSVAPANSTIKMSAKKLQLKVMNFLVFRAEIGNSHLSFSSCTCC